MADDHDLFRVGVATMLSEQDDMEVVAQASGGRMAVRVAASLHPDVVLMELRMPDLDGEEATRQILRHDPDAHIVALTVATPETDVIGALTAGVCGYVTKDSPIEDIALAVRSAARGAAWLSPSTSQVLHERLRRDHAREHPVPGAADGLSQREVQVLRLLARGLDNGEIAGELGISPSTAKNHTSRILAKLALPNRVQAAVFAVKHGLG